MSSAAIARKQSQAANLFTFPHDSEIYLCCCNMLHVKTCAIVSGISALLIASCVFAFAVLNHEDVKLLCVTAICSPIFFASVFLFIYSIFKGKKLFTVPFILTSTIFCVVCLLAGIACLVALGLHHLQESKNIEAWIRTHTFDILTDQPVEHGADADHILLAIVLLIMMFLAVVSCLWVVCARRVYYFLSDLEKYQTRRFRLVSRQMSHSMVDYLAPFSHIPSAR